MSNEVTTSDEFATAMQQLSAEAEKSSPHSVSRPAHTTAPDPASSGLSEDARVLVGRLESLEHALCRKIAELGPAMSGGAAADLAARFQKIEEQLVAIRGTESVNQRLFDSLHEELLKYRDNFLHESLQKPFIHDLVMLFDDLTSLSEQLETAAQEKGKRSHLAQWRDNLENAIHSLMEILHRFEVKEVEPRDTIDRELHRIVSFEPTDFPQEDGRIVMRVRRGFSWRGKLIRPEEVIAKRYG